MSLKIFHIAFILLSVLTCFLLAFWSLDRAFLGSLVYSVSSIISLAAGIFLAMYGHRFYQRIRKEVQ